MYAYYTVARSVTSEGPHVAARHLMQQQAALANVDDGGAVDIARLMAAPPIQTVIMVAFVSDFSDL